MTTEFLYRIRKELTITLAALRETLIAIAERVNRKVQILQLHYQAANVSERMRSIHQAVGVRLAEALTDTVAASDFLMRDQVGPLLGESASQLRLLKKELAQIDARIGQMELETVREELFQIHRDLSIRSAVMRRVVLEAGSQALGRAVSDLPLPSGRVAAVLRGSALLTAVDGVVLQQGDVIVIIGLEEDLATLVPRVFGRPRPSDDRVAAGASVTATESSS
jgi:hypothetical protein